MTLHRRTQRPPLPRQSPQRAASPLRLPRPSAESVASTEANATNSSSSATARPALRAPPDRRSRTPASTPRVYIPQATPNEWEARASYPLGQLTRSRLAWHRK